MKQFHLLFLILTISVVTHSQSIKGKLADPADKKPLIGATLTLGSLKNATSIYNTLSDSAGAYLLILFF